MRYAGTRWSGLFSLPLLLAACVSSPTSNTIKSLEDKKIEVDRSGKVESDRAKAIASYRDYLNIAPRDSLRPEALRRLGDMEYDAIDRRDEAGKARTNADQQRVVRIYEDLLRQHPRYAGNDRVLYQLARAHDEAGEFPKALAVLDRLVNEYPASPYREEAQFRRGEILFTLKDYPRAEQAYTAVLGRGVNSRYYERSLYMQGWSRFKQGSYDEALLSLFDVLDRKLIGKDVATSLEDIKSLSRSDREIVEDTMRVISISLASLDGANSIPAYFSDWRRKTYEFHVYQYLGDFYAKQNRVKDSADTYNAYARRYPMHPQAPIVQVRVIDTYTKAGFGTQAIETKKEFVDRYGVKSDFRRVNSHQDYARVLPHVRQHTEELARHYHASAQKTRAQTDYDEGAKWYRTFLESFPADKDAARLNYLFADLLLENRRYAAAAQQYERTAYDYPTHAKSADAGYAALTVYGLQEKCGSQADPRAVQRKGIDSALRFTDRFVSDPRVPRVLTDTAEKLYALRVLEQANEVARRVLALKPSATAELQRTAWVVIAHTEFERGQYPKAEQAYQQVLAMTPAGAAGRGALNERLAASVYKQGEQARQAGNHREAVSHFERVAALAPTSTIRVNAEYDAAASLITLKDWNRAAASLQAFRARYPNHALSVELPAKLAVVYLESGQTLNAAAELEKVALGKKDAGVSREALWQAGELYEKAGKVESAKGVFERYARTYPSPFEPAIEARFRLTELSAKQNHANERLKWCQELVTTEQHGGSARTDRTRYVGATCALALTEPADAAYRSVRLVEPLKQNLKIKKEKMEVALAAYGRAADYGVAEVATAATYRTAELYQELGKSLMDSQRPKGLKPDELEQYNVLLEEQAFPFEEKAIEIHEINAKRVKNGFYDVWVKKSFGALAKLRPVRYAKNEKHEGEIHAIR